MLPKNDTQFESGQKWLENNYLDFFIWSVTHYNTTYVNCKYMCTLPTSNSKYLLCHLTSHHNGWQILEMAKWSFRKRCLRCLEKKELEFWQKYDCFDTKKEAVPLQSFEIREIWMLTSFEVFFCYMIFWGWRKYVFLY